MQKQKYHINQPDTGAGPIIFVPPQLPGQPKIPGSGTPGHPEPLPGPKYVARGYLTRPVNGFSHLVIKNKAARKEYSEFRRLFEQQFGPAVPAPGLEVIGCGYDVFGLYADSSSLKGRLFDLSKMGPLVQTKIGAKTYNHWPIVTVHPLASSVPCVVTGSTFLEYTQELSVSAEVSGTFKGFHAQAEGDYSRAQTKSQYNAFTNVFDVTSVFAIHLMDRNDLRDFLTPRALEAIDNWDPDRLFDEFGLRFLTGAIIGGRLNHWSVVDTFYLDSQTDLEAMAEADYLFVVGASSYYHSTSGFKAYQAYSQSETATLGGDPSLGGKSIHDDESYQRWKDSVPENPFFIDFTRPTVKTPLTPIWTLALGARRAELEAREPDYIREIVAQFESEHAIDMTRKVRTYCVTTHTGSGDSDGTPGKVYVNLKGRDRFGNQYESGRLHHRVPGGRHRKGAVDPVSFSVVDLGELTKISVTHENDGEKNGWGIDLIEVLCQQNGKKYCAPCYTWLEAQVADFDLHPA